MKISSITSTFFKPTYLVTASYYLVSLINKIGVQAISIPYEQYKNSTDHSYKSFSNDQLLQNMDIVTTGLFIAGILSCGVLGTYIFYYLNCFHCQENDTRNLNSNLPRITLTDPAGFEMEEEFLPYFQTDNYLAEP